MPVTVPCAHDGAARDDQLVDVARGGAGEQQIERIDIGPQPVVVDRVPVEQQDVGRLAGGQARRRRHG